MQKVKYIQYGEFGTFNHVLQYKFIDKDLSIITRDEGVENRGITDPLITKIKSKNKIKFAIKVGKYLSSEDKNIIVYYVGSMFIPLFNGLKKKTVLDLRTFSVDKNIFKKYIKDIIINLECFFFEKIYILSNGMRKKLWSFNKKKSIIVPLGAEPPEFYYKELEKKSKENIIIYVGTFNNRKIGEIITAFDLFKFNDSNDWKLEIIGRGSREEIDRLNENIEKSSYRKFIKFYGEIRYPELACYLAKAKIGISYIPIDDRYNIQPSTKTYEYISAGCLVICSDTTEHREIIKDYFGILVRNNREELAEAMKKLCKAYPNTEKIEKFKKKHSWRNIYNMIKND